MSLDIVLRGATHERRKTQKSWPRAFNSTLLIGDVTGDGLSDLLIGQHPRHLGVFVGVPWPDLFSQRPQDVAIAVAQRRGIHLVGGPQQGRQAGHPHAPPVHATRCSRGPETAAGNRAASGDSADRPLKDRASTLRSNHAPVRPAILGRVKGAHLVSDQQILRLLLVDVDPQPRLVVGIHVSPFHGRVSGERF